MLANHVENFVQVAGHTDYGEHNVHCILVSDDGSRVLKLIQQPPRGQKELMFYRRINGGFKSKTKALLSECNISKKLSEALREDLVAKFHGVKTVNGYSAPKQYGPALKFGHFWGFLEWNFGPKMDFSKLPHKTSPKGE